MFLHRSFLDDTDLQCSRSNFFLSAGKLVDKEGVLSYCSKYSDWFML